MPKVALAFSGGKDSWACLWLNKDRLKDIVVIWVNTGKNYPEALRMIDFAKTICPNFGEITVDREGQNKHNGIPSDIVPVEWTNFGQSHTSEKEITIQSYTICCYENIGSQIHKYCKDREITELIRGQRIDEEHKSTARDGDIVDGIKYSQPIESWTKNEVIEFNAKYMDIPTHFHFGHSSLDCYDCSAFLKDTKDISSWAEIAHPDLYKEKMIRVNKVKNVLTKEMNLGFGE